MPCELEGPPFRRHRLTEKTIVVEDGGGEVTTTQASGVTAVDLCDDVLLEIFKFFYTEISRPDCVSRDPWHMLVHVCRRWRHIVFASPHYLNLRLHCTNKTPVRKMLDVWPAFSIVVMCHNTNSSSPLPGVLNIIAALKSYDRVCEIDLSGIPDSLLKRFAPLTFPFPALTSLQLHSDEPWPVILPDTFLGGFAPLLRSLRLNGIPFPAPKKLLLSCTGLATLCMENIPETGYVSPEEMATCLSALINVEEVTLGFRCAGFLYDQMSSNKPLIARAVLPALTSFGFRGHSWYLEVLISQIDVPLLDNFDINVLYLDATGHPIALQAHWSDGDVERIPSGRSNISGSRRRHHTFSTRTVG